MWKVHDLEACSLQRNTLKKNERYVLKDLDGSYHWHKDTIGIERDGYHQYNIFGTVTLERKR